MKNKKLTIQFQVKSGKISAFNAIFFHFMTLFCFITNRIENEYISKNNIL